MPFTVADFPDLLRLLGEHPEWQAALRRHILTDELLAVPGRLDRVEAALEQLTVRVDQLAARLEELTVRVDQLTVRVDQLAARLEELTVRVDALAEAQARTEQQLATLTARVDALAEAQARTEQQLAELAEAQRRTGRRLAELAEAQLRTGRRLDTFLASMGGTVEEVAEDAAVTALRARGYDVVSIEQSVPLDGEGELDVVLRARTPEGQMVVALVEAKLRLQRTHVQAWGSRVQDVGWRRRLAKRGIPGPYLPYLYGLRRSVPLEALAQEMADGRLPRIGLLAVEGEVVPAPLLSAA